MNWFLKLVSLLCGACVIIALSIIIIDCIVRSQYFLAIPIAGFGIYIVLRGIQVIQDD